MRLTHAIALLGLAALGGCTQSLGEAMGEITRPIPQRQSTMPAPAPTPHHQASAPAPAPAPAAVQSQTGGHVYSVGREYGMQPDAIGTRAPQGGTEMFLTEVPSTPSLAGYDESDDQPRRRQSDETTRP